MTSGAASRAAFGLALALALRLPGTASAEPAATNGAPAGAAFEDWPRDIGYIRVLNLDSASTARVVQDLKAWAAVRRLGVVADLRGASGGDPEAAAALAAIVEAPAREPRPETRPAVGDAPVAPAGPGLLRCPLVVLTDGKTADAAARVAVAWAGAPGCLLMGEPTAGPVVRPHIETPAHREEPAFEPDSLDRNGTRVLDQELEDRRMRERIGADFLLRRAVDLLIGLRAMRPEHTGEPHANR